jgi:hypothetical protein
VALWTLEVTLAADSAIILACSFLQINAKPRALCNVYGPDIFDDARPMGVRFDLLADFVL